MPEAGGLGIQIRDLYKIFGPHAAAQLRSVPAR